jgi:hypothetical protein
MVVGGMVVFPHRASSDSTNQNGGLAQLGAMISFSIVDIAWKLITAKYFLDRATR